MTKWLNLIDTKTPRSTFPAAMWPDPVGGVFVITEKLAELPEGPISLQEALENDQWNGTLVYAATDATKIPDNIETFINKIKEILNQFFNNGALIFLPSGDIEKIHSGTQTVIPLRRAAGQVKPNRTFNVTLTGVPGVDADINPNVVLSVPEIADNAYILFTPNANDAAVTLGGPLAPKVGIPPENTAKLHFGGMANGALTFSLFINENSLFINKDSLDPQLNLGFQVLIPNPKKQQTGNGEDSIRQLAALLPLAETKPQSQTTFGFSAQVNVLNPNNQIAGASRTVFYFTGKNGPGSESPDTQLVSYFRTNYGKTVWLIPSQIDVWSAVVQQPKRGWLSTPVMPRRGFFKMVSASPLLAIS